MPKIRRGDKAPYERPLSPLTGKIGHKAILVYDFESKKDETQEEGFTRPFMVGFLDIDQVFSTFFSEPCPEGRDWRKHVLSEEGCVDRFLRHVLGFPLRPNYRPPPWTSDKADLFAHNGGRFDITPLILWLFRHRNEFSVRLSVVQGRVHRMDVWKKGEKFSKKIAVSFVDSYLILPMKLSDATKLFSTQETKDEKFDRNLVESERDGWTEYNRRDCVGLRDSILGFQAMLEREGGELGATAPASAMKLFRRRFLGEKIDRAVHFPGCDNECGGCERGAQCDGKCHGCLHAWIRSGYFGGRVEPISRFSDPNSWFFSPGDVPQDAAECVRYVVRDDDVGEEQLIDGTVRKLTEEDVGRTFYIVPHCFYFDRNSSYPASMLEPMPIGKPVAIQTEDEFWAEHRERRAKGQLAFVECVVSIPKTCPLPPLPHVPKEGQGKGKLCFPVGQFAGVFEYDELFLLFDPFVDGKILHIERAVWFESDTIFKSFVETLYRYRLAGSAVKKKKEDYPAYELTANDRAALALAELAKLMMNSLYGKFAMNAEREEVLFIDPVNDPWPVNGKPLDGRHEGGCPVWTVPKWVFPDYVTPHLSARVTALGRIAWWKGAVHGVIRRGGKVYAGDTDALVCSIPLPHSMIDDKELGKWKREHTKKVLSGEFPLPKFYRLSDSAGGDSVIRMKGVPRDLQTDETFELLVSGGELRRSADDPSNKRFSPPKTAMRSQVAGGIEGITMLESVKRLRAVYDKRIVLDDGTTRPLAL